VGCAYHIVKVRQHPDCKESFKLYMYGLYIICNLCLQHPCGLFHLLFSFGAAHFSTFGFLLSILRKKLLYFLLDLQRRIELLQDFSMPTSSSCVKVSTDGQNVIATGPNFISGVCLMASNSYYRDLHTTGEML